MGPRPTKGSGPSPRSESPTSPTFAEGELPLDGPQRIFIVTSGTDQQLLARLTGEDPANLPREPERLLDVLERPEVFTGLFEAAEDPLLVASPLLVFGALVGRVAREIDGVTFTNEWVAPGRQVPVFDVEGLRAFSARRSNRRMLAGLLTSYTRVASGAIWSRTPRGWRRRRFSELDPLRLASLLEVAAADQRPQILGRLGDLALFLSGVFPEYVLRRPLEPRHVDRLRRLLDAPGQAGPEEVMRAGPAAPQGLWIMEWMGRRAYRLTGAREAAENFRSARRFLNLMATSYLFRYRDLWFSATAD